MKGEKRGRDRTDDRGGKIFSTHTMGTVEPQVRKGEGKIGGGLLHCSWRMDAPVLIELHINSTTFIQKYPAQNLMHLNVDFYVEIQNELKLTYRHLSLQKFFLEICPRTPIRKGKGVCIYYIRKTLVAGSNHCNI